MAAGTVRFMGESGTAKAPPPAEMYLNEAEGRRAIVVIAFVGLSGRHSLSRMLSILDYAAANALEIVSADSDFGELLAAARGATRPSVVFSAPPTGLGPTSRQRCWRQSASGSRRPGSRRDRHHCAGPDANPVTAILPGLTPRGA